MIVQSVAVHHSGATAISFTLPHEQGAAARTALEAMAAKHGYAEGKYDDGVGKVSLVGAGMRSHPGESARLCSAVYEAGIYIDKISTSEIRISVVRRSEDLPEAGRACDTA